MYKANNHLVKEIKNKVSNMSSDAICLASDIKSLSEIAYDYCAYNPDFISGNIMTLAEMIKEKSRKLIEIVDETSIEVFKIK